MLKIQMNGSDNILDWCMDMICDQIIVRIVCWPGGWTAFIRWKILQDSGWLFLILNKYQTIAVLGLISPTRLFWNSIIQKPLLILQITNFPHKGLSKPWLGKCSPWEKWILQHFKPYFSHFQNSSTPLHWSCCYKVWLTNCFDNLVFQKNHIKISLIIYSAYLLYLQIYVIFFTMGGGGGCHNMDVNLIN